MSQSWTQTYDPFGNPLLSTLVAAVPVTILFVLLAVRKTPAYRAAPLALLAALVSAVAVFRMPWDAAVGAVANGVVFAVVRMAWTLLAAVFVYNITVETGNFEIIKQSIGSISDDRRLQLLLVAFAFGALLEGSGGGGAPVAITGAMMVGLGFPPFQSVLLCLIANSGPVAWGGMGNPVRVLVAVTGLPEPDLCAALGRILPWTTLILPFWLVWACAADSSSALSGGGRLSPRRAVFQVWPALVAAGVSFGAIQFFWSNFMENSLVDLVSGVGCLAFMVFFLRWWRPRQVWRNEVNPTAGSAVKPRHSACRILHAWSPFLLLAFFVVLWGLPGIADAVNATTAKVPVPGLHMRVVRQPPVVAKPYAEPALFDFAWLAAVGTATFLAGLVAGPIQGLSPRATLRVFFRTFRQLRLSLLAVLAMVGLGYLTRYSGMDAVLGLAMVHTGWLYPLFGTLIGWIGVALTGTDAGSNALFGSLQVITAKKLALSPVLMATANSAGGVMGKMIAGQSLVVGCAAVGLAGKEGSVFRAVMVHSLLLAMLIGAIVFLYAYVFPGAVPSGHQFLH